MSRRKGGRRIGDLERRWMRAAWDAGASNLAIALLVGRSFDAVQNYLHSTGRFRYGSNAYPDRRRVPRDPSPAEALARDAARRKPRDNTRAAITPTSPFSRCPDCGYRMGPDGHPNCRAA